MCQSKAQGGRRCAAHTAIALEAALDHTVNTRAARDITNPENMPDEDWAHIQRDPDLVEAAWAAYHAADENHRKARAKVRDLRWALAQTTRGNLELHALADIAQDAAAALPEGSDQRETLDAQHRQIRAHAVAAATGADIRVVRERFKTELPLDNREDRTRRLTALRERSKTHPGSLHPLLDNRLVALHV